MMKPNSFVIGSCTKMCSLAEADMRGSRNLAHYFEKNGKFIKEFSRSAADKKMERPEQIRTFEALIATEEYLFNE
jgi:hypothetical protein